MFLKYECLYTCIFIKNGYFFYSSFNFNSNAVHRSPGHYVVLMINTTYIYRRCILIHTHFPATPLGFAASGPVGTISPC